MPQYTNFPNIYPPPTGVDLNTGYGTFSGLPIRPDGVGPVPLGGQYPQPERRDANPFLQLQQIYNTTQRSNRPGLPQLPVRPVVPSMQTPNQAVQTQIPPAMMQNYDPNEIARLVNSMYTPDNTMSNRLKTMLDTMPQRNEVSGLRKLGGFLVGLGQGPDAQERAMYSPYYRQMQDWKTQWDPTYQAANLERYGNANERMLAYQTAQATTNARRVDTQEQAERRRQMTAEANIERDKVKNQIAWAKYQNPDLELVDNTADGFIHVFDPRTGETTRTTLKHGDMTDLEKAQWRRGDIQERGAQARQTLAQRPRTSGAGWTTLYDLDGRAYDHNRITGETYPVQVGGATRPPTGGGGTTLVDPNNPPPSGGPPPPNQPKPETEPPPTIGRIPMQPGQEKIDVDNRVAEILARNPEWKRWVRKNRRTGSWDVDTVGSGTWFSGELDKPTRDKIIEAIWPKGQPITTESFENDSRKNQQQQNLPSSPSGKAPPPGAKPGGKWIKTARGTEVWVNP